MRLNEYRKTGRALAAVAAAAAFLTPGESQGQTTTNLLSLTTFEQDAPAPWAYGYFYNDDGLGFQYYVTAYYEWDDFEFTNAMYQFVFDLSLLEGRTGYGTGTGAPLHTEGTTPADFISFDRGDYIFTFDARVEGLAEGQTSANAEMQVKFRYPVEGQEDLEQSLQINIPFRPTTEWQTFSFSLDEGGYAAGTSAKTFAEHYQETTQLEFAVNFHEPHLQFGYEGENHLFVDNLKLEVVDNPFVEPPTTVPKIIAAWDFDTQLPWYSYSYEWSGNTDRMTVAAGNNANGNDPNAYGVDGTSGWFLNFDNSIYGTTQAPPYAGGGTGGSGPVDYTRFDSPDLADYQVVFDARVEGLSPTASTAAATLQIFTEAPDETIETDEDTDRDGVIQLNVPISGLTADWQTFTIPLNDVNVGGGSKDLFSQHHAAIDELRTQWQVESAGSFDTWEFDANNVLSVDNFRLERLYPIEDAGPELNVAREGNEVVLTWEEPASGTVTLQSSGTVNGEYSDVEGAASGYRVEATDDQRFFRLAVTE